MHACDVAILGGGPAGCAAALSLTRLRPSLRVVVVEASRYDRWRAGETLPPGCRTILESLGCWEAFVAERFVESLGTSSVWGGEQPFDNEFLFSRAGNGWHLDRARFDRLLADCARRSGAEVWTGLRAAGSESLSAPGWRVTLRGQEGTRDLDARFVVDATGRAASFAAAQGARKLVDDRLIGVSMRFHFPAGAIPADTRTLVEAQENGWWYSARTPDSRVVVVWMSDADLIRSRGLHLPGEWLAHLRRSSLTWARVEQGIAGLPMQIHAAQSQRLSRTSGPGWAAAGDAAGTLDPLSSQGIAKAMRTGKLASFVALDFLAARPSAHARYNELLTRDYERYRDARSRFYSAERRWPESPFWSRRHHAHMDKIPPPHAQEATRPRAG